MSRRRGRQPSPEERRLWEQVTADVDPLAPRGRARAEAPGAEPDETPAPVPTAALPPGHAASGASALRPPAPPSPPPLSPLEPRQRRRIARGTRAIDMRIDLHGLTQAEAHVRLRGFLSYAQSSGAAVVLVITGKGAPGGSPVAGERGILRRVVPQWLSFPEFRPLVVGFEEAHAAHGGGGALYVRIRKSGKWGGR